MLLLILLTASALAAQSLPGTTPLVISGEPITQMLDGFRVHLERATEASVEHRKPNREWLREIDGAVDPRVEFAAPDLIATMEKSAKRAETSLYTINSVRWPVFEGVHGEGLLYEPKGVAVARVVALPMRIRVRRKQRLLSV